MSKGLLSSSDKKLMLKAIDYLISDVSSSPRWKKDGASVPRTLMQLRFTRKLVASEAGKVSSFYFNNLFIAIEFFREAASASEKLQLSKIRNAFESLPRFDDIRSVAHLPENSLSEFEILVDGSRDS